PPPVAVTAHSIDLLDVHEDEVRLRIHCSAGFYVRALANDLGALLGTGAHLAALRRTAVDGIEGRALPFEVLKGTEAAAAAADALVPMGALLPGIPAVTLVADALPRVQAGRELGAADASAGFIDATGALQEGAARYVRLL